MLGVWACSKEGYSSGSQPRYCTKLPEGTSCNKLSHRSRAKGLTRNAEPKDHS